MLRRDFCLPKCLPTTQCQVGPCFLSNSCLIDRAMSLCSTRPFSTACQSTTRITRHRALLKALSSHVNVVKRRRCGFTVRGTHRNGKVDGILLHAVGHLRVLDDSSPCLCHVEKLYQDDRSAIKMSYDTVIVAQTCAASILFLDDFLARTRGKEKLPCMAGTLIDRPSVDRSW